MGNMARAQTYIWDKKTDTELQLWPITSRERYLTTPFLSPSAVNKEGKRAVVIAPPKARVGALEARGISASALTRHKGGYYQSRTDAKFHVLFFTCKGGMTLGADRKKFRIRSGSLVVSPAGTSYELASNKNGWELFWFHIAPRPDIDARIGKTLRVENSRFLPELRAAVEMYAAQIYAESPERDILEILADLIFSLVNKNISPTRAARADLEALVEKISADMSAPATAAKARTAIGVSKTEMSRLCSEAFGKSFSEEIRERRMRRAMSLLRASGKKLVEIAAEVGYADAFTFSKAFKTHFGVSPSDAAKRS